MDNSKTLNLDELVAALRADGMSDRDFAQRVALVCARLADQSIAAMDETPSTRIRAAFELSPG